MSTPIPNAAPSTSVIKSRIARGGLAVGVSTTLRSLLELGATLVTARLLTPADFGLVGMVLAVIGFVDMFKDLGLATVTVQRAELDQRQLSNLFWMTAAMGTGLALLTALSAPFISWAYDQPSLTNLTLALSSCLLISAFSVQHVALLKRELRFERLAIVQTLGTLVSVVTVIWAALAGFGVWALVLRQLAAHLTTTIAAWLLMRWTPGRAQREGMAALLSSGGHVTGFQVMNYLERNLDNVLIGKFSGAVDLGCYTRAYDLLRLPLQQIGDPLGTVAMPTLSRMAGDAARYRSAYLRIARTMLLLTLPLGPYLIICADWLIFLAFGPQWSAAVAMFRFLGIAMLTKPLAYTLGWVFVSQERNQELMRWGVIATVLAIASFLVGLPWGATGVALSYALLDTLVRLPLLIYLVGLRGPVSSRDLWSLLLPNLLGSALCTLTLVGFRYLEADTLSPGVGSALGALVALVTAAVATASTASGRSTMRDLRDLLRRRGVG